MVLNSDLIEHIEITPDTVISLTTGQKIVVLESADEIVQRVVEFRRAIGAFLASLPRPWRSRPDAAEEDADQAGNDGED
jgi:flagellar protein FlbD